MLSDYSYIQSLYFENTKLKIKGKERRKGMRKGRRGRSRKEREERGRKEQEG